MPIPGMSKVSEGNYCYLSVLRLLLLHPLLTPDSLLLRGCARHTDTTSSAPLVAVPPDSVAEALLNGILQTSKEGKD